MSGQVPNPDDAQLEARATLNAEALLEAARLLRPLSWPPSGLTRDMIRKHIPDFPAAVYLHLPASKHYSSIREVLFEAERSAGRAEGEYLSANFDFPEEESLEDGGPPAWGPDALLSRHGVVDGGSAEDRPSGASSAEDEEH